MDESTLFEPDVTGGTPKREPRWVGVAASVLVVVGWAVAVAVIFGLPIAPYDVPSIDSLSADYRAHRSAFARLAPLAAGEDFVIDPKGHAVKAPRLSKATVASVKATLREIGAQRIEGCDGDLNVELGSEGLAVSGVSWGYYYSSTPPPGTVSIEVARSSDAPSPWYCSLGDGWYATVYSF